jgi:hypothetical protein
VQTEREYTDKTVSGVLKLLFFVVHGKCTQGVIKTTSQRKRVKVVQKIRK